MKFKQQHYVMNYEDGFSMPHVIKAFSVNEAYEKLLPYLKLRFNGGITYTTLYGTMAEIFELDKRIGTIYLVNVIK